MRIDTDLLIALSFALINSSIFGTTTLISVLLTPDLDKDLFRQKQSCHICDTSENNPPNSRPRKM